MAIKFLVDNQTLSIVTPVVVADTHAYITAEAEFVSDDWTDLYKWAHFTLDDTTYDVPLTDDAIPASANVDLTAGTWKVFLTGNELVTDGVTTTSVTRITTSTALLYVQALSSESTFPSITPSFSEVLAAQVAQALSYATEVYEAAEAGDYTGATFTPAVNANGIISWTNDKGLDNPDPVDISGPQGEAGTSFTIKGFYDTYDELAAAVTSPSENDCYGVGTASPYTFYLWDAVNSTWVNVGQILGAAAGFGTVTATVDSNYGTPAVDVTTSGTDTAKNFTFTFRNLRGYTPVKGTDYFTADDIADIVSDVAASVTASGIGAIADPVSKSSGQVLKYNGSSWVAASEDDPPVVSVDGMTGEVETRLIFTDVPVAASDFTLQSTPEYSAYPYVASVPLEGITDDMIPEVIFDIDQLSEGIFAGAVSSYSDGIYIYSAAVPSSDITIPTIILWR